MHAIVYCRKSFDSNRNLSLRTGWTSTSLNQRNLWIRLALFEKVLAEVIEYLVESANKYYEKDALMSDPVHGPILASLLGESTRTHTGLTAG